MASQNLVEEHLFLAELIAFDYANIPGCQWDEACSEANVALMRAADAYDPKRGEFIPFSSRVIRNALNSLYAKQLKLAKIFPKSLDDPIKPSNIECQALNPSSAGINPHPESPQDTRKGVRLNETSDVIESLMGLLTPREQVTVMSLKSGNSYREIGASLGISKQAAHKSAKSGLRKLRAGLDRLGFNGVASDGNLASKGSSKKIGPQG